MNTIEYLEALKKRYNWSSDYRIAKEIGISQSRISNYRTGKTEMDERLCIKVANLLEINPAAVLIDITAERTKCEKASEILHETAAKLIKAVASIGTVIIVFSVNMYPAQVIAKNIDVSMLQCILC